MIFDTFVRIVERHPVPPEIRRAVELCRLFKFEFNPHEVLPKHYDNETCQWFWDNLYLPFPIIGVEDNASCIVLWDESEEGQPPVQGAWHARQFVECIGYKQSPPTAFQDGNEDRFKSLRDFVVISMGSISIHEIRETQFCVDGNTTWCCGVEGEEFTPFVPPPEIGQSTLRNALTALQEIMLINNPEVFILESTPLSAMKQRTTRPLKPGQVRRVARSHERSAYTILKPHEIRERMKLPQPEPGHRHVRPHERRSYMKTLRSEFFKAARGKTLVIPASWVGPSENTVSNRRYRVILDH